MTTDFSRINPCGECCDFCGFYYDGGCRGCCEEKRCEISDCCKNHYTEFCGACREFPCERLKAKYAEWHKDLTQVQKPNTTPLIGKDDKSG